MKGILADINIQGHVAILERVWKGKVWGDVWAGLSLTVRTFADVGLPANASDAVVWHLCQQQELVLITANRNDEVPDSLEATIRDHNTVASLPVFTLADSEGVRHSHSYAERVAESLLEYFVDIDKVRGTGRLYVPKPETSV